MKKAPHKDGAGKGYLNALNKLYSKPRLNIYNIKAGISPADFNQYDLPGISRTNKGVRRDGDR